VFIGSYKLKFIVPRARSQIDKMAKSQFFLEIGASKRFINIVPKEEFDHLLKEVMKCFFNAPQTDADRKKYIIDMNKLTGMGY